jgi:Glycosyltransferase family 87
MSEPQSSPSRLRRALLACAVLLILAAGGVALTNLFLRDREPPVDFAEVYVAAEQNLSGNSPYDAKALREAQRRIGHNAEHAVMMWMPPWVLTVVMPFAALPFRAAYGMWALVHIGLVLLAAELLWRGFAPDDAEKRAEHMRRRWVAYLLALTFAPTTYLIGIGQITAVVLAGLAGFLVLTRANRPLAAGAAVAITATKPHLLTLFAVWLLLEALRSRAGRRVVLGGALVGAAACVPPTLTNPHVWEQYAHALTAPQSADHLSVSNWATPLAANWLRGATPGRPFWVQFVPAALAVLAFSVWFFTCRRAGEPGWARALPWAVGLSLLVAPYGAWAFDLVLLVVPILAVGARVAAAPNPVAVWVGVGWLAAVNAVVIVMMLRVASSELYVWVTPVVLLGAFVVSRLAARPQARVTLAGA